MYNSRNVDNMTDMFITLIIEPLFCNHYTDIVSIFSFATIFCACNTIW